MGLKLQSMQEFIDKMKSEGVPSPDAGGAGKGRPPPVEPPPTTPPPAPRLIWAKGGGSPDAKKEEGGSGDEGDKLPDAELMAGPVCCRVLRTVNPTPQMQRHPGFR